MNQKSLNMSNKKPETPKDQNYMPRFLVTQKEYDCASPEERKKFNYVVDDTALNCPKVFSVPEDKDGDE
jgi:hypothetical protein